MEEFRISDGMEMMDFPKVTQMQSKSFWSPGIKIDEVVKGASNSALVVGAFDNAHNQVGYARVVSDKTRFAYIMDVYVDENFRKKGIGRKMISYILSHYELKDVYQWLLITKDAHEVYSKAGFKPISNPLAWMEIRNQRPIR
ncbi:acetyltransferase [Desulfosporosinus sp. I2]|uniref:GNAT family N-acetyltransferase n=1 Tax=Desulfosporosinus sp. I2 TaxID=1617025 RepID=UPI00061F6C7D|nr:GNAT family N-acetyltransferase [Desulfosporosinus sp. I2]KJR44508.1 acetyltransferase [Desulfosporosinus sp. I2]